MKLYLIRHFQRVNQTNFYAPLTGEGINNAKKFAESVEQLRLTHAYSSPYLRAIQSIFPVYEKTDLLIRAEPLLGEYRDKDNHEPRIVHENGVDYIPFNFYIGLDLEYKPIIDVLKLEKPETEEDLIQRVIRFVSKLRREHADNDNILVVTHSSVIQAFKKKYTNYPCSIRDFHPYNKILQIDF